MKILLATDGSRCSEEAARFLAQLDFGPDDQILVLHVLSEIPYDDDYHAKIKRLIRTAAPKIIQSTMGVLSSSHASISSMAVEGYPDTAIIETALEEDVHLVVMGARGVRGIKLLVLGSSTRSVAINSPRHTMVIKQPLPPSGVKKILFAFDGSDCSFATGNLLTQIPFPGEPEVTVLHVTQSPLSDIPAHFLSPDERSILEDAPLEISELQELFDNARGLLGRRFGKIKTAVLSGSPAMQILTAIKASRPDLVAVGSRGLRGVKGMLGSVSRNVLAFAQASVIIGKVC